MSQMAAGSVDEARLCDLDSSSGTQHSTQLHNTSVQASISDSVHSSSSNSVHASGSQGRQLFSGRLPPLQVRKETGRNLAEEPGERKVIAPTSTNGLSWGSKTMLRRRIYDELSQLNTPLVRELMRHLATKCKIETPKVETSANPVGSNPFANIKVGDRWREFQGCNRWIDENGKSMLDPIDTDLRAEIVRYGEFAQACYDAFDGDKKSKYCGSSRYTKDVLLEKVGLHNRGYEITHFLYATASLHLPHFVISSEAVEKWSKDSNWMGFVAVCTSPQEIARLGRRDILVAWRGTKTKFEWIKDLQDYSEPAGFFNDYEDSKCLNVPVRVESGFLDVYMSSNPHSRYNKSSIRVQVVEAVNDLVKKYKHEGQVSITMTGHSLGSALATLCAYDMAESQFKESGTNVWDSNSIPITVFSFGGPRVGNHAFQERVERLGVAVLRVANKKDLVTKVPGLLFRPMKGLVELLLPKAPCYKHVGTRLKIDFKVSHYLEIAKLNLRAFHHLEAYIHVIDGLPGPGKQFEPTLRDFALVNKACDLLKSQYRIPPFWWQEKNKGLVQDENGHWVVPERDSEIFPKTPKPEKEFLHCVSIASSRKRGGPKDPVVIEKVKYLSLPDAEQGVAKVLGSNEADEEANVGQCSAEFLESNYHVNTTMSSAVVVQGPNGDWSVRRYKQKVLEKFWG